VKPEAQPQTVFAKAVHGETTSWLLGQAAQAVQGVAPVEE
jgi:hypothetical protein